MFDEEAAAERLWQLQLQRASRNYFTSGLGSVDTRTVETGTPTRSQPRQPAKTPPPKKAAAPPVKKPAKPAAKAPAPPAPAGGGSVAKVIAFLYAQVGEPYVWGAAGPSSWDCSGLTMRAFQQVGINLPHQSEAQARYGHVVPRSQVRAGDLLHWDGHVAVAISATQMIHASRAGVPVKVAAIYGSPTVIRLIG